MESRLINLCNYLTNLYSESNKFISWYFVIRYTNYFDIIKYKKIKKVVTINDRKYIYVMCCSCNKCNKRYLLQSDEEAFSLEETLIKEFKPFLEKYDSLYKYKSCKT